MASHGLIAKELQIIQDILVSNVEHLEKVAIFGSRATGAYTNYSDVDLVLYGDIAERAADRLWTCFEDSLLPYKVDISIYKNINYPPLRRHIDHAAQTLFTHEELCQRRSGE